MERYCPSCFAVIDEISSKCPVCGVGIKESEVRKKGFNRKLVIVPLVVMILITASLMALFISRIGEEKQKRAIVIDGEFEDWTGVTSNSDTAGLPFFNPNINIIDFRIDSRDSSLSFYILVNGDGDMLAGEPAGEGHVDTAYIFIDTDQNPDTGYFINGIGADNMLEIYGRDGEVQGSTYYFYTSAEQDWNHWDEMGTVDAAAEGTELETQISFRSLFMDENDEVDVLFYMQSWDHFEDFSDYVISNEEGVLVVTQQGIGWGVFAGSSNRILELELRAVNADITLNGIRLTRRGIGNDADVSVVRLMDGTNIIAATASVNGNAHFPSNIMIDSGSSRTLHIEVDIRDSAQPGNSIGFRLMNNHDITINQGTVSLNGASPNDGLHEVSYIQAIPENISIDGAFSDWEGKTVRNDTSNDVVQDDLDILRYGLSNTDNGPAFYLSVDGEIGGGRGVPFWNNISELNPDWEDDSSKTGEDVVRIFIDTVSGTGYQVPGTPLFADFMIEIRGRHNTILSNRLLDWSGHDSGDWTWIERGLVEVVCDSTQMEIGIRWEDIMVDPSIDRFSVFFLITDWESGGQDYSDAEGAILGPTR